MMEQHEEINPASPPELPPGVHLISHGFLVALLTNGMAPSFRRIRINEAFLFLVDVSKLVERHQLD